MGCPVAKTLQGLTRTHSLEPSRHWRQKRRHKLSDREEKTKSQTGRLALYSFLITAVNKDHKFNSEQRHTFSVCDQKSHMGLIGLKSRCGLSCLFFGDSEGQFVSLPFPSSGDHHAL